MNNFDYKTKYLKYKKKYLDLKNNQTGGEIHYQAIRKDGNTISFPNGFPDLSTNGSYNIVHAFDQELMANQNKLLKLEQLKTWVTQTLPEGQPPAIMGEDYLRKTWNIYNSANRQDFIDLINWLDNPNE